MAKPTWAKAAKAANGRCAIVVTAFIEGITCRRPDDKVFFILALSIGDDSFVILTTDAKETSLLGERAKKSEGFGSGRCPLYADGAQAARWCASATAEDPAAVAAEIESEAKANALGLITGAAKRGSVTQSRTLQDFWGAPKKAKTEKAPAVKTEDQRGAAPRAAALRHRTPADRDVKCVAAKERSAALRLPAAPTPLRAHERLPPSTSRAGAPPRPRPQPANDPGHEDDDNRDERAAAFTISTDSNGVEIIEID